MRNPNDADYFRALQEKIDERLDAESGDEAGKYSRAVPRAGEAIGEGLEREAGQAIPERPEKDRLEPYSTNLRAKGPLEAAEFGLEQQTESSRLAAEQQTQARADEQRQTREAAENRAAADRERDDFSLTGSDRTADVAMAGGQAGLFSRTDIGGRKTVSIDAAAARIIKGGQPDRSTVVDMGDTPSVLLAIGLERRPLVTSEGVVDKAVYEHGLSQKDLRDLPALLADPVSVLRSDTDPDAYVVVTERFNNGEPIIAIVRPDSMGRAEVNLMPSVYGKGKAAKIASWMSDGLELYRNTQKSPAWATTARLQLPGVVQPKQGRGSKLLTQADIVNGKPSQAAVPDSAGESLAPAQVKETLLARAKEAGLLPRAIEIAIKKGKLKFANSADGVPEGAREMGLPSRAPNGVEYPRGTKTEKLPPHLRADRYEIPAAMRDVQSARALQKELRALEEGLNRELGLAPNISHYKRVSLEIDPNGNIRVVGLPDGNGRLAAIEGVTRFADDKGLGVALLESTGASPTRPPAGFSAAGPSQSIYLERAGGSLPQNVVQLVRNFKGPPLYSSAGKIQGYYSPDGSITLFADAFNNADEIMPVFVHELVHQGEPDIRAALAKRMPEAASSLDKRLDALEQGNDPFVTAAMSRVRQADTPAQNVKSERLSYLAQAYEEARAANKTIPAKVQQFFDWLASVARELANRHPWVKDILGPYGKKLELTGKDIARMLSEEAKARFNRDNIEASDGYQTNTSSAGESGNRAAARSGLASVKSPFDELVSVSGSALRPGWAAHTRIRSAEGPTRVYRGSETRIESRDFARESLGLNSGSPTSGLGVFFAASEVEAGGYGKVGAFHLDIRNPKVISGGDLPDFNSPDDAYRFREALRKQGYDGIVIDYRKTGGQSVFVAFEPDRVVRAKPDALKFSRVPDEDNIGRMIGEEAKGRFNRCSIEAENGTQRPTAAALARREVGGQYAGLGKREAFAGYRAFSVRDKALGLGKTRNKLGLVLARRA